MGNCLNDQIYPYNNFFVSLKKYIYRMLKIIELKST